MKLMTKEEKITIVRASIAAKLAGNTEEAERLLRTIPVSPEFAKGIKDSGGAKLVLLVAARGYDFSEAEAVYGKDWLDK
jgi:hypothetical protein